MPHAEARARFKAVEAVRIAFLATCAVLASGALVMMQRAPQVRSDTQQQLATELAAENRAYCEKWGMRPRTREHVACTLDLDEIRARAISRVGLEPGAWFP